jgi:hypothetical protein
MPSSANLRLLAAAITGISVALKIGVKSINKK